MAIVLKTKEQISRIREACKVALGVHEKIAPFIKRGVSTRELDKIAEEYIRSKGATPSFLGYKMTGDNYPASICASINEVVIHGIPDSRKLENGDIISVDVGAFLNGYHGDCARTYIIGDALPRVKLLVEKTRESFFSAMEYARTGYRLHEISAAIEDFLKPHRLSVIREFCGHGIGRDLHEDPQIPHYRQTKKGPALREGMTLAIEPMVAEGMYAVKILKDDWTVVTKDGSLTAHYEDVIAITDGAPDVLTR